MTESPLPEPFFHKKAAGVSWILSGVFLFWILKTSSSPVVPQKMLWKSLWCVLSVILMYNRPNWKVMPWTSQKHSLAMFYKKSVFKIFSNIRRATPVLRLQHSCFPVDIKKFSRKPILKNLCEGLLLRSVSEDTSQFFS